MKIIHTKKRQEILVDDDWYEMLRYTQWSVSKYAVGSYNTELMHRLIMDTYHLDGRRVQVDHINGNKLDNRVENLRVCNGCQNRVNAPLRKTNTSGYKGVVVRNRKYKGRDRIRFISKIGDDIHIGQFSCIEIAAWAYNLKAKEKYGDFARLNKIIVDDEEIFKL